VSAVDKQLLRMLHGELEAGEEAMLRRRVDADPRLGARLERLQAVWMGLEPPPPSPVPAGFTASVLLRTAGLRAWGGPLPLRARALAAVALVGGIALGMGAVRVADADDAWSQWLSTQSSLAEDYWTVLGEGWTTTGDQP